MKKTVRRSVIALALCASVAAGQEITGFSNGHLTFLNADTNLYYRIEFRPNLTDPGEWQASLPGNIKSADAEVTVPVGVFYRVAGRATPFSVHAQGAPLGMVEIPGGTNSGTNPDAGLGSYSLTVGTFHMDRFPVTKWLWDAVHDWAVDNGYQFDNPGSGKAASHPVHTVNWYDAVKWCNARSEREGREPVYRVDGAVYRTGRSDDVVQSPAAGYRLPTSEEWEYAARGGVADRRFPWGDSDDIQHSRANYFSDALHAYDTSPTRGYHPKYNDGVMPYTSPVGEFAPNGYGLYDLAGNVIEWCFDASGSRRLARGYSWKSRADLCRVGFSHSGPPDTAADNAGFRVVLSPGQ